MYKDLNIYKRTYVIEELDNQLKSLEYNSYLSSNYGKSNIRYLMYLNIISSLEEIRFNLIQQEFLAFVKTLIKV